MTETPDPELVNLLDELSKAEGQISSEPEKTVEPAPVIAALESVPVSEPTKNLELEEVDISEVPSVQTAAQVIESDPNADIRNNIQAKLLGLVNTVIDESEAFKKEMEVDRKKCDDVYNLLAPKIQSGTYSGSDAVALVQILQVKADISSNRSKHMDSIAKIFVSLKSNAAVGSGDAGGSGGGSKSSDCPSREEVLKLLNTPADEA